MLPGRAVEVARIGLLLGRAREGASAALIVHGDPGVGKTTLLDAMAAQATGFIILRSQPLQTESRLSFAGLSDLLRPLHPALARIPAPQAAVLAGALALGPPTSGDRFAAAVATLSLLAAGAEETPLLAIVDDAHWLDAPSLEAILFAGRRLGNEGVVLLLAMRDRDWLDTVDLERMELRGLGGEAATQLIDRSGRSVSPIVHQRLITETGGNPLALQEALATLSDEQLAGRAPILGPIAVGRNVERSFAQRLEQLSSKTRHALLIAATSQTGDAAEIGRALGALGLAPSAADPAERDGLISTAAGRISFRHPLLRAAAYHAADPVDRRAAHRALAGAVHADRHEEIAWHLASAVAGPDEDVARALEESAATARARGAYSAAANALATAAHLSPDAVDRVRRTMLAADAFRLGGQGQAAADLLIGIEGMTTDPILRADIQLLLSVSLMFVRPMWETMEQLLEAADRVESSDPGRAATMLSLASIGATGNAPVETWVGTSRRAVELAGPIGGPVGLLAGVALANALALAGRVHEARATMAPVLPLLESIDPLGGGAFIIAEGAHALCWMEDWDAARRILDRLVTTARAASAITMLPFPLTIQAEMELRRGQMASAYSDAAESVRIAADVGQDVDMAIAAMTLARVEATLGREQACRDHAATAREVGRRLDIIGVQNYVAAALGLLDLSLGRPERAIDQFLVSQRLEETQGVGSPTAVQWSADLVESYIRVGRHDDAVRALATLEDQARRTGSRWAAATAARCRGLLADEDTYEAILRDALVLHADEQPYERARTELCLGRRLRHSRRRAAARTALHDALTTFDALGAELWAEQTRAELRATGASPAPSPEGTLMTLTPQEIQVALVIAGGATNKEAGASLFISHKTVEFHLGHIYGKLGVRSRSELVRKVLAPR